MAEGGGKNDLIRRCVTDLPNFTVDAFDGQLIHYCVHKKARVIVRVVPKKKAGAK